MVADCARSLAAPKVDAELKAVERSPPRDVVRRLVRWRRAGRRRRSRDHRIFFRRFHGELDLARQQPTEPLLTFCYRHERLRLHGESAGPDAGESLLVCPVSWLGNEDPGIIHGDV